MFDYQQTNSFFAQIADGLEELGYDELSALGAKNIRPVYRGLYFEADKAVLYRINYMARLITRVLAPLTEFPCYHTDVLYKKAKSSIRWEDFFDVKKTFAIFSTVSDSKITHSQYAGLRLKDAIADYFREHFNKRPDVDSENPDIWINLHIEKDDAIISLDTSGGSLHRRGYRKESVAAPMQETVAAAIIQLIEWDGLKPLYDPMCGSGTLLCEALMNYCQMPAGILRKKFGFMYLPDYDDILWSSVKKRADQQIRELPEGLIAGSDILREAVSASRQNFRNLLYGNRVKLDVADFNNIRELKDSVILCNPPYGIRLKKEEDTGEFYKSLGDFFKKRCQGSTAFVYFGNREMIKHIGLKSSWKRPLKHGGLDGRLVKYEMY